MLPEERGIIGAIIAVGLRFDTPTVGQSLVNGVIVEVDFGVRTCVWSQLDSQQIEGTMKLIRVIFVSALIMVATAAAPQQPTSQMSKAGALRTKVVLLGTGTPVPDPERSGPATAMIVAEEATASLRASRREVVR